MLDPRPRFARSTLPPTGGRPARRSRALLGLTVALGVLALGFIPNTTMRSLSSPILFGYAALVVIDQRLREDAADTVAYFLDQGVQIKVISGDNPLTVDPAKLKDIAVWGTVQEGRVLPVSS